VAKLILSGTDPPGYELVPLREGVEFTLYRGRQEGNQSPVLVVVLAAECPSPQSLRRLEHEYSFAAEVDPAWVAKPSGRSLVTKGERSSYSKSLAVQSLRCDDTFLVKDRLWYGSYLNLAREMVTTCMDQLWQPIPSVIRLREE
jgi:hypothetical protein